MEIKNPWTDSNTSRWLRILSLPTLEWARPFIPHLDLPDKLLKCPEVWKSIYTEAANNYENRVSLLHSQRTEADRLRMLEDYLAGVRTSELGQIMRQTVTEALQNLAKQIGWEVAVKLEQWIYFHFFCSEFRMAMYQWSIVLSYSYLREDSRRGKRKIPPPEVLISMQPEIYDLGNYQKEEEIRDHLMRIAPPAPEEQIPKMEHCYEATLLSWALSQSRSLRVLRLLASRLNDTERKEVVVWAQAQLQAMSSHGYTKSQQLCGDKYLQKEFPLSEIPSVLKLESLS